MNKTSNQLKLNGSHYTSDIPGILHDYALKNPYMNAASTSAIADVFGVDRKTISNWMKEHEEFRVEVEVLRTRQLNLVESQMMKRILGYTVTETKTVKTDDSIVETKITKEIPPDAALIRYYLAHRSPECWGEKNNETKDPMRQVNVIVENNPEDFA